jgi:AraC family transcriptional regulator, melibiose operon regulatory protein
MLARWLLKDTPTSTDDRQSREALKRISPILRLIEENYSEPLSLGDMARAGHLSRSHCCDLFRLALNTTPIAYRNARRISEGRRLLKYTDMSIHQITHEVGFSSVQEFNRLFRRECDLTPTQFRTGISSLASEF